MATRSWTGGTGFWNDPSQWLGGFVPQPGDTAVVSLGEVAIPVGAIFEGYAISLGSVEPAAPAIIGASGTTLGYFLTVASQDPARHAALVSWGITGFNGHIYAASYGGSFALSAADTGATPGNLILLNGATVQISSGDTMSQWGTLSNHALIDVASGGTFNTGGTIAQSDGFFVVEAGGALVGGGEIDLGLSSGLFLLPGSALTTQTVRFTDAGALLEISPASFNGQIYNFQQGDFLTLDGVVANSASYDAGAGLLTVSYNGTVVATLNVQAPAGSPMTAVPDGAGGTRIQISGTQPLASYGLTADDRAMRADIARATFTASDGSPINGAGVKIGIISDSFDAQPGFGSADPANAAALAGYLPLNPATGTCAVTVLNDLHGDDFSDEGRAIAELIYKTAPGAQIFFNTVGGDLNSFAAAVTNLQQVGCQIIVDDSLAPAEPFFQDTGPLDAAINQAVAAGVSYFSESGNQDGASFQAAYNPQNVTLSNGSGGPAQIFADGTPYQTLTLLGGVTTTLVLQYAAPFPTGGLPGEPSRLMATLFDMNGNPVAWSQRLDNVPGIGNEPGCYIQITPLALTQYRLAIQGLLPAGTPFKYVLFGSDGGSGPGGFIDDPAAHNTGSVVGHDMLPGVNVIGAVDFATTPAFGSPSYYTEYYSGAGPGEFLFDRSGNPLPTPQVVSKPNLVVPVNGSTDVPGFAPFGGTSPAAANAAAVAALVLQRDPSLMPAQVSNILESSAFDMGLPANAQGAGLIDAYKAVQLACYAAGTRLLAPDGYVAIERVAPGDLLVTLGRAAAAVRWVGCRKVECVAHPYPANMWPVRIAAHAFGEGRPVRPLFLSPDHAVFVDGCLIPIRCLVNGTTIRQFRCRTITYFHIELERHDILVAEGLPAESFLDTGNRGAFGNGDGEVQLHPVFERCADIWEAEGYAPLTLTGAAVDVIRRTLAAQAALLRHRRTRRFGELLRAA